MNEQRPSFISHIYACLYGNNDFRENNYVLLEINHRPSTECWFESSRAEHTPHIRKENPDIKDLVALGNYLSDRINWLFEVVGKVGVTQAKIANEPILKLDLANNTLDRIDEQIPVNFGEAFSQM